MDCIHDDVNCTWPKEEIWKLSIVNLTIFFILDGIIELLALVANSSFLFILVKQKSLHSPSNMLLGALCVADLAISLVLQPVFLTHLSLFFTGGEVNQTIQDVLDLLFDVFFGLSFTFIILISLDRYIAICHPFKYQALATCKSHLLISFACGVVISGLFSLDYCLSIKSQESLMKDHITSTLRVVHYVIPAIVIIFCYCKIYLVIRAQSKRQISIGTIKDSEKIEISKKRSERRKTGTIALILVCFFACYAPNFILVLIILLGTVNMDTNTMETAWLWTSFTLLLTSLLNPIVYYLRSREIRQAARKLCKRSSPVNSAT
ncbi:melatonin receptor type 1A-like [Rhopilema esculentum]|uniref:melatonin receptor type 1A-like n=1 Tax=Rhopilema esculentum TaxID=499914 RepID=UPI0031D17513|eukprot:gene11724-102_t